MGTSRVLRLVLAAGLLTAIGVPTAVLSEPARIGVLTFETMPQAYKEAFRRSLRDQGFSDGREVAIDWRSSEGSVPNADKIAAEFVRLKSSVIVASLTPGVAAVMKATKTIPIVMAPVADPVATGFVTNLAHPGGNVTGISNVITDVGGKLLGLLREVQPDIKRVAVLLDSRTASAKPILDEAKAAAARAGIEIVPVWIASREAAPEGFGAIRKQHAQAVIVQPLLATHEIAELARQHRVPSIATGFASRSFPRSGGLIGYGSNPVEHFERAAVFVAKILRGAKAGDLPVEQATTFQLVINTKTAKALGVEVPKDMLLRANEVIE